MTNGHVFIMFCHFVADVNRLILILGEPFISSD